MIRFDSVPTVETSTKDNLTDVYISHKGRYWTGQGGPSAWIDFRLPVFRFHSGDSEALGRALRQLADRMDPGGAAK